MAIDTGMYSLKQFQVAVKAETTLGTALVTGMQKVNIDGYPSVSRNPERYLEVRHGEGNVAKQADVYIEQKGKVKEISFTALYDQTLAPIFLENCIGAVVGVGPASYAVPYNYTGPECATGDTDSDNTGALTVALISPEGSNTEIYPGCIVSSLRIYADLANDGGRFKMDVVLQTRHNIAVQAAPTSPSAYPTTYRTLYDLCTNQSLGGSDIVMNRFEVTLNNNAKFHGNGCDGVPQSISRGLPEFMVTGIVGVKYDANTAALLQRQYDDANVTALQLANNATFASATFGVDAKKCFISDNFDPADADGGAFMDVPLKMVAGTSRSVIDIIP